MKVPGKVLWALIAMNILIGTPALPAAKSVHFPVAFPQAQIGVASMFEPAEQARICTEGVAACVNLHIEDIAVGFEGLASQKSGAGAPHSANIIAGLPRGRHASSEMYAGRADLGLATLRRPEIMLHPFRAYPLPFPNADLESPLTYRI
jgi:hypothetical protein